MMTHPPAGPSTPPPPPGPKLLRGGPASPQAPEPGPGQPPQPTPRGPALASAGLSAARQSPPD